LSKTKTKTPKISFDDNFVAVKLDKVECVEVISKKEARRFTLVHPKTAFLENLEVKDQFVWDCIDGETSLGELKQKYYQKFKVLPSQQMVEKMRRWYERGFLEGGGLKKRKPTLKGGVGIHLPAQLFRVTLGQITRVLISKAFAFLLLLLGLAGLGFVGFQENPLFIFDSFSNLSILPLLLSVLGGAHLGNLVRILFMFGALSPAPTYCGDRLFIGFWGFAPVISLDLTGLRLKAKEKRMAALWVNWATPVFVAGLSAVLPIFLPMLADWKYWLYGVSMGCLIDFALQSCTFYHSRLMRLFDELGNGVPIQRLKQEYAKGRDLFLNNYSDEQEKAVQWSTVALVFWVVVGSSFLLFCSAQFVESLTEVVRQNMNMDSERLEKVQWALYLPVLLAFFLLLWKLVQPFVQRLMSFSMMRDERVMIGFQMVLLGLIPLGAMVLPELLLQFGLIVGVIGLIVKSFAVLRGEHWTFRLQAIFICITAFVVVFQSFFDLYRELGQIGLAAMWLVWAVARVESMSPRGPGWWIKLIMVAALSLVVIVGINFLVQFPIDGRLMFALGSSLCFGAAFWMLGGSLGWQLLPLGFGLWTMLFASILLPVSLFWGQVFYALGLFFMGLSQFAWIKCRNKLMHKVPHIVVCDPENFRASLEGTLSKILHLFVGETIVKELGADAKSDVLFLGTYEKWIKRWMPKKLVLRIMQESIGSIPWDHRAHWSQRLERFSMPKQTKSFTKEMRLKFLKSQLMFKGFDSKELEVLADYMELQPYLKGDKVTYFDEPGHPYLEIVATGQLRLQEEELGEDDPKVLADLGKGEAVRTEDLFTDQPYKFDSVWMSDGATIKLHRVNFLQWSQEYPELFKKVLASMALSEMISKLSLFKDFSNSQMGILMEKLKKIEVPANHDVIEEGTEGDEFFLLDQGEVDVLIKGNKVASLSEGSYFGEIALLQKCLRTATIRTSKASTLYALVQKDFDRFFASGRGAQVLENVSQQRGAS
jgi:CRP-like cAMP-binding protein